MKPKTLPGLPQRLALLYVAIIITQRPSPRPKVRARLCTALSCLPGPTRCARLAEPSGRKARCQTNHRAGNTKPQGLWGAADTGAGGIRESRLPSPKFGDRKLARGHLISIKGRGAERRYHRRTTGPARGRGGWTPRGWFRVAILFPFVAVVFFFIYSVL